MQKWNAFSECASVQSSVYSVASVRLFSTWLLVVVSGRGTAPYKDAERKTLLDLFTLEWRCRFDVEHVDVFVIVRLAVEHYRERPLPPLVVGCCPVQRVPYRPRTVLLSSLLCLSVCRCCEFA